MCHRAKRRTCGKGTFSGGGQHVEQVLAGCLPRSAATARRWNDRPVHGDGCDAGAVRLVEGVSVAALDVGQACFVGEDPAFKGLQETMLPATLTHRAAGDRGTASAGSARRPRAPRCRSTVVRVADRDEDVQAPVVPHLAAALVDIFVYVVVLNLFVEYFPNVLSETFTLSLLTAVLLKGVLEVVLVAKNRVKVRFKGASTPGGKVVAGLMLWAVLFGSKFVVLEVVGLVFGSRVSLGGFVSVTLLVVVLLLSRAGVRHLLERAA